MQKTILGALTVLGLIISTAAAAVPMYGVRTVYFNASGRVQGIEVQLCKPGGNGGNALAAGSLNSPYYRIDETVCSGETLRQVCHGEMAQGNYYILCGYELVDVGWGVYTRLAKLPAGMTLEDSMAVYNPDGANYPEIWSVGIESVKADILNSGGTWSDN